MKVIVIGGGKFGTCLAGLLLRSGCSVKLIELQSSKLPKLSHLLPQESVILGSGTNPSVLETAGIADADVVAAVTGADEVNLVAATISKFEYATPRVIARVNDPRNAWLFDSRMGVDAGLNQADFMAHLVLEEIDLKNLMPLLKLNRGEYSIVQVAVDERSAAVGQPVQSLDMPETALLIAVHRHHDILLARGDTVLQSGDQLLLFSSAEAEIQLNALFGAAK